MREVSLIGRNPQRITTRLAYFMNPNCYFALIAHIINCLLSTKWHKYLGIKRLILPLF